MTVGVVYLFILLPALAVAAGLLTLAGTHRDAHRIRTAEAERRRSSA